MQATKGQLLIISFFIKETFGLYFSGRFIDPSMQVATAVEQQIPGCLSFTDKQRGIGLAFQVMVVEGIEVEIRQDVGVVHKERFTAFEQRACFLDASARIEQPIPFVTDVYVYAKVIIGMQEINNLFTKVVDIDCDVIESRFFQP